MVYDYDLVVHHPSFNNLKHMIKKKRTVQEWRDDICDGGCASNRNVSTVKITEHFKAKQANVTLPKKTN